MQKKSPNIAREKQRSQNQITHWLSISVPGFAILFFLLAWEIIVHQFSIEHWILPSPTAIVQALWEARALLWDHTFVTIIEAILGLGFAVGIGILLAILIEWSPLLKKIIYPFLVISQTIPTIALAPLLVIWFGYGITAKIVIIALVCFFPVTISLVDGFRLVDKEGIRLLQAMGASKWQLFRILKIPASLPTFFSGLRIAGTYSILGAVISEWFGANKGLGILLMRSAKSYLTARVFATILIISILSLLVFLIIEGLARLLLPWHYWNKSA